jgi:HAMP domain-containing protein
VEPEPPFPRDPKAILELRQKDIKKDVERLLELATELKKEVDKTDSSAVLSMPLLRKTEEIEKLAKHIRSLARG